MCPLLEENASLTDKKYPNLAALEKVKRDHGSLGELDGALQCGVCHLPEGNQSPVGICLCDLHAHAIA